MQVFDEVETVKNSTPNDLQKLENVAVQLTRIIQNAADSHIPKIKKSDKAKVWWNQNLTDLRKDMAQKRRFWKETQSNRAFLVFQNARNAYFAAIKNAKSESWNSFLSNAYGNEIFKAFQFTKMRKTQKLPIIQYKIGSRNLSAKNFEEKCKAFIHVLFLKPPEIFPFDWSIH